MEMKWHTIIDGDLSGIPRDEEFLFTVFDEEDDGTYVTTAYIVEYEGEVEVRKAAPCGLIFYKAENVKAWMDYPEPYKPVECNNCPHRKEWTDEFGDNWFECELLQCDVPPNGKLNDCQLNR